MRGVKTFNTFNFSKVRWNQRIFPENYELSFEQFNYEDLKNKIQLLSNEKLRLTIGESNKKFINSYLDSGKLSNQFKDILNE